MKRRRLRPKSRPAASKFSAPLARSAYDLQSRFYNILELSLVDKFLVTGSARDKQHVIDNATFLIAQYHCWTKLARREIQFIDLGRNERTRELSILQDKIFATWERTACLRLFACFRANNG